MMRYIVYVVLVVQLVEHPHITAVSRASRRNTRTRYFQQGPHNPGRLLRRQHRISASFPVGYYVLVWPGSTSVITCIDYSNAPPTPARRGLTAVHHVRPPGLEGPRHTHTTTHTRTTNRRGMYTSCNRGHPPGGLVTVQPAAELPPRTYIHVYVGYKPIPHQSCCVCGRNTAAKRKPNS